MADETKEDGVGGGFPWKSAVALAKEDGEAVERMAKEDDRLVGSMLRRLVRLGLEAKRRGLL